MQKQQYLSPMHPAAEHNYEVDFTDLLQGIGGSSEIITGTPTVEIDADTTTPPGFSVTFQGLDAETSRKVIFRAGIGTSDHEDDAYKGKGATVCIVITITTTSGSVEVQQVELIVNDQC